jgi:RHH-type proline utilization regulon transcriptional repressor/proline dehydrogenase/delta 1-pyrroline-5-carboxylate dehydrogenase
MSEPVTVEARADEMANDLANDLDAEGAIDAAVELAAALQGRAIELQTPAERRQQAELDRMLQNPSDKATLIQLTDQAFRSRRAVRRADQLVHVLEVQGVPRFFGLVERTLLRGAQSMAEVVPQVAMPLVEAQIRKETANIILPAEPQRLALHLRERAADGVRLNVNLLGEAILGEDEAEHRLQANLQRLQMPEIETLSIKISTLYSQISALAHEHTVALLCDRTEVLVRSAAHLRHVRADGAAVPKFIYLDMEEYRDMELTAEVFMRTLDRPGLAAIAAGIVLQAYIPDAWPMQQRLVAWARQRVAGGGAPITIRLVKGANMEMERVEGALRGWPQAPYRTKAETDANFKRMVGFGMRPENLAAVRLGIASHNLLDVAYAFVRAARAQALDRVQFEMLEGMANPQRRALGERTRNLLLYAPACERENFLNAIGYLIRRLDENTGAENFLRHAFRLQVGDAQWLQLVAGFRAAFRLVPTLGAAPRRTQDRAHEAFEAPRAEMALDAFDNEPDTDFALRANSAWADALAQRWQARCGADAAEIALVIDGETVHDGRMVRECRDPSRPGVVVGRWRQASEADVRRAIACARRDPDGWRAASVDARSAVLGRVAQELRAARGELIGAALTEGGKTVLEADPEVSEAVDFCEIYRSSARAFHGLAGVRAEGKGVVVVVSPWNFPIAIPCGGIAAALAAGNTVILKPASDTVLVAWELCQCFWRAGVSRRTLQFLPCAGAGVGAVLVAHPAVDAVILTGGTETALRMLRDAPAMSLYAETGGKNATIVTAMADREQAVKHVVHSAFSHGGQKCSATSLLLLQAEVHDDPKFRRMLVDAVRSLRVGPAWRLETRMGPLIRPPSGELETALKTLEPGESWALRPQPVEGNPCLWTPGIKWGVSAGSRTHLTEFFGPLLGVMRFETLDEAVALVNQTGYGLTSGLESLDDREHEAWKAGIRAGNLYLNRPTTGAIVLRQPFGGLGKSCFGPGLKAGGPNYVAQLMRFAATDEDQPADRRIAAARQSIAQACRGEFHAEHDHFRLLGQDNIRRYLPPRELRVRLHADDTAFDTAVRMMAAWAAGGAMVVSAPPELAAAAQAALATEPALAPAGRSTVVIETDAELAARVADGTVERLRYAAPGRVSAAVRAAAAAHGTCICDAPVVAQGRVELLWYLHEQSLSDDYHRHGNLGARAGEKRRGPA